MSEPKTTARPGAARCTIELYKEAFKFSAAHFTLFSARERERLHGHDFFVSCALTGPLGEGGLIADYGPVKRRLRALCGELDEVLLLPGASPWLQVEPGGDEVRATFAGRTMSYSGFAPNSPPAPSQPTSRRPAAPGCAPRGHSGHSLTQILITP
jgi:6-pyruvoyl-tetrahydropterin synthase